METAARFASEISEPLWRSSWQAGVLVVVVALLNWMLRAKLSPNWRCGLWILVLIKLAVPFSLPSAWSLFNVFDENSTGTHMEGSAPGYRGGAPQAAEFVDTRNRETLGVENGKADNRGAARAAKGGLPGLDYSLFNMALACWLIGITVLATKVIWSAVAMTRSIRRVRPLIEPSVLELFEDCKEMMQVTTPMIVVEAECVKSPMLHGFLRPRLLLPCGLTKELSPVDLRNVFLHELAHVRRSDIVLNWVAAAVLVVHWFNPLVWFAVWRMRHDREVAADALVLSSVERDDPCDYGNTLVRLARCLRGGGAHLPSLAGIIEVRSQIEGRILAITQFSTRKWRPLLGAGVFIVLAVFTLTDAQSMGPQAGKEGAWTKCASAPAAWAPAARMGHSATWTGREWIVWGGRGATYLNDGAIYDPNTDTWRGMSTVNAPSPRWFHAAVWTGVELLVWGGRSAFDAFEVKGDGARYNPTTDKWTAISAIDAPAARSQMGAVWTGTELLIWGGCGAGWRNEVMGGRYSVAEDRWRTINPDGAPETRMDFSTIWTGDEMVIWGGIRYAPDVQTYSTGARYNPRFDSWTLLPDDGSPSSRNGHTAVWTGTEMLIWGGHEDSTLMNTGARFNMPNGHWVPMSTNGAPQPRYGHVAVWTGSEMIVWGGLTGDRNLTFSGARYRADTGDWKGLPVKGAPAARCFYRDEGGVWTGTSMLIYGGSILSEPLSTAYRYTPPSQ